MRTRQFARVEKIRSKERNLLEVLRRQVTQQTLDLFPPSVHPGTPLQYNAPIGGTSVTIYAPLVVLAQAPARTYVVDTAASPDPTGGFAPVTIPASNALCELDADTVVNFAGQPAGEYTVYAAHQIAQEHPETRHPPTIYAEGAGVNSAHRDFFGHSEADNTPIPREAYDPTLTPETISEWVDRVAIAITTGTVGPHARLLIVNWNGSVITQVREPASLYADLRVAFTRIAALETSVSGHIGARGNAHGLVSTGVGGLAGFMSPDDKAKLDSAPANIQSALDAKANATSLSSHVGSGGTAHAVATTAQAGFMSAADKTKLDEVISRSVNIGVPGRTSATSGPLSFVVASSDGQVLRRRAGGLGFGRIETAGIEDGAVTNAKIESMSALKLTGLIELARINDRLITRAKLSNGSALSVIGRSANSAGAVADISAGTDGHVLRRSGTTLGFGTIGDGSISGLNASKLSGTVARARLPVGATNSTQVAPGQAMTGSGDAQHPVGSMRLVVHTSSTTAVSAGDSISGSLLRVATSWTTTAPPDSLPLLAFIQGSGALPGTWQALNSAFVMHTSVTQGQRNPFLAVRVS